MALDPRVISQLQTPQFQPPQVQSPLDRYSKILTLRNLMETGQLHGLQAQKVRMEIAAAEREAADDRNFRASMGLPEPNEPRAAMAPAPAPAVAPHQDLAYSPMASSLPPKPLATMMTFEPPAARPEPQQIPPVQVYSLLGPKRGAEFLQRQEQTRAEYQLGRGREIDSRIKNLDQFSQTIGAVLNKPTQETYQTALNWAAAQGFITPEQQAEYARYDIRDPQVQDNLRVLADRSMSVKEQLENERANEKFDIEKPELQAKSLEKQLDVAARTVGGIDNQADWTAWREALSPELKQRIPSTYSPAARDLVRSMGYAPKAPTPGVDVPYSEPVFKQKRELVPIIPGRDIPKPEAVIEQEIQTEKRKAEIQAQNSVNKALSGDAAKVYSIATTIVPELQRLRAALAKDYEGTVSGILLGTNRELRRLAENVADKVGRIRSGGAVNKEEERRFFGQIASAGDLLFGESGSALQAIDALIEEAQTVSSQIKPSAPGPVPSSGGTVRSQSKPSASPAPSGGGTVRMRAPDGTEKDVPADKVDLFKRGGAVIVSPTAKSGANRRTEEPASSPGGTVTIILPDARGTIRKVPANEAAAWKRRGAIVLE